MEIHKLCCRNTAVNAKNIRSRFSLCQIEFIKTDGEKIKNNNPDTN